MAQFCDGIEGAMNTTTVFEPPVLTTPSLDGKWNREYAAFLRMLPELLQSHRGQYVAIHEGRVVASGLDKIAVARESYRQFGPVEILVRLVTDARPRVVHMATPQVSRPAGR